MIPIKIISWNVNGIRPRIRKKQLNWFLNDKPDIFCIQRTRTKLNKIQNSFKNLNEYFLYFSSYTRGSTNGVAVYTKREPNEVYESFENGKFEKDGRILILNFENFILYNINFPIGTGNKKNMTEKLEFFTIFLENMSKLKNKLVIVCGDFNIAHKEIDVINPLQAIYKPKFLTEERTILDELIKLGFTDTFRIFNQNDYQFTWWNYMGGNRRKNFGMRLDYVFVSKKLKDRLISSFIRPDIKGSDHCPIGCEIII